ncbi:MAG: SRPBCC family protein [Ramlibacter sp.]|nr:SRPBCC family protein [Ramlibacter sp.]
MPLYVCNQQALRLPLPVDAAFQLFTPKGEESWIPEWRPRYIRPADGKTEAGMVFTTGEGAEFTIWQVADFDAAARKARYARTTPALRVGMVTVDAKPLGDSETEVLVRYEMTALSGAGEESMTQYEGEAFVQMIGQWREMILRVLPRLTASSSS